MKRWIQAAIAALIVSVGTCAQPAQAGYYSATINPKGPWQVTNVYQGTSYTYEVTGDLDIGVIPGESVTAHRNWELEIVWNASDVNDMPIKWTYLISNLY